MDFYNILNWGLLIVTFAVMIGIGVWSGKTVSESDEGGFLAYAAEEVLERDPDVTPLSQAEQNRWFTIDAHGRHAPKSQTIQ